MLAPDLSPDGPGRTPRPRRACHSQMMRISSRSSGIALAVLVLIGQNTWAQRSAAPDLGLANFDIRTAPQMAPAGYLQRVIALGSASLVDQSGTRAESLAALRANVGGVDLITNPGMGTPEVVSARLGSGFLTGPSDDRVAAMRGFLTAYAGVFGLTGRQVADLELVADYANPAGNMAWVELEQTLNGVPVFQGLIRGGFTAEGELARTTGPLAAGLDAALLPTAPAVTAAEAIARAAGSVGWSVDADALVQKSERRGTLTFSRASMASDARAWLIYFPIAPGAARLAWATEIWGDPDVFLILQDAEDGTVLFRKNLTSYQTQPATYTYYNDDSPAPMSPSTTLPGAGTQASYISRTTSTLIGNEGANAFNNLGWMTDGMNGASGWTDGNNVEAGLDLLSPDGIDPSGHAVGTNRSLSFTYNPASDEPLSTPMYQSGEVTDQFVWVNRFHDATYLLGFTEQARNFQNDNFGRGGSGLDRISAEAEDSSGTSNANFSTPADGGRGRMQMYIFPGPTPDRSSGLDHDVLVHELTHGLSNRLHSNGTGLGTTMAGSMGEGWSDFYARALLSTADEDPNGIYSTGGWVTKQMASGYVDNYYYGVRRFPYAVKSTVGANGKPHNPLTLADIDASKSDTTDGAYPPNPIIVNTAFAVHNAGEVWCVALIEVRARFIERLGWAEGNQRVLQFITDGMKLDLVNPTFLDGRNAILMAAAAGGGTQADIDDIWAGFAARGMGQSARIISAGAGTVVEAFDVPGINAGAGFLIAESIPNGRLDPAEVVSVSLCLTNTGESTTGEVTGTLQVLGGVIGASGAQGYGTIAPGSVTCRTYSFTVGANCGDTVTATLKGDEPGQPTKDLQYTFPTGSPVILTSESFDAVTAPALPAGWTTSTLAGAANLWVTSSAAPDTAPYSALTADPGTLSDNAVDSPTMAMPPVAAVLTFRNRYYTQAGFDGGVLEIAIDGGVFADIITAGGSFISGGYNRTISSATGSPIAGRQAWSGDSVAYGTTSVNLPVASQGKNVRLRWRMASDTSGSAVGWAVDTVVVRLAAYACGTGVTAGQELIQNGGFAGGTGRWLSFATPDPSYMVSNIANGVLQFNRVPPPPGTSNQVTVYQETGVPLAGGLPLLARFKLGNTSSVRKRISVLTLDSNFSDLAVCTFWLPPNAPLQTYMMQSHTTQAWTNASIYFYAATPNVIGDSGFYQIDTVSLQYAPVESAQQTPCIDPTAPAAPGGSSGPNLLINGDFNTGTLPPWATFGTIASQLSAGVFEFIKPSNTPPAGVVLQATGQAMTANQILTADFQLGNSSGVRKRVTVLLHDNDFSDLAVCTFYLAPGQPLSNYAMRTFATKAWTSATLSVYPATVGAESWMRLDEVRLQRTPSVTLPGTVCAEPSAAPLVLTHMAR